MAQRSPTPRDGSAFLPVRADARFGAPGQPQLQELQEMLLLLRGDSVVDWHRLALRNDEDVKRLLLVNSIDVDSPADAERLDTLRAQGVRYVRETLGLRLSDQVAEVDPLELFLIASGRGRFQREACILLKVMHVLYHLDARELRKSLPIPDMHLFTMVEESLGRLFEQLQAAGVPVVEFAWSRKTRESLVTKLLVKRETYAAQVFDRLRFRLVVDRAADILPTLQVMLQRFVPFNYVVPTQTVNTLVDIQPLLRRLSRTRDFSMAPSGEAPAMQNEFTAREYQTLNFVADLPVRVDGLLGGPTDAKGGSVVFVLAEFQIVDRARAIANERGDSSHAKYKHRQHQRVRERLLREPKKVGRSR
jgi:uncharacterized protein (TIGR04552 family)